MADLFYNGQVLIWKWGNRKYKASSGLLEGHDGEESGKKDGILDYRYAKYANKKDHGPTPSGLYSLVAKDSKKMALPVWDQCNLKSAGRGTGIQTIPRGAYARNGSNDCEDFWANWGYNRIKFFPKQGTKTYGRSGFYLHDSTKAYTHGCIEVEKKFFDDLRHYSKDPKNKSALILKVVYKKANTHTYGFTDSKHTPVDMLLP